MIVSFHYSTANFANVYFVGNEINHEAIIIDPASFTAGLLKFIEARDYYVKAVLLTHDHPHHREGLNTLLKIYQAQIYSNNSVIDDFDCTILSDGQEETICGLKVNAISVPGHSSDSMAYKIEKCLFTGDAIQAGMIGSTYSKYSNKLLKDQLAKKIMSLPDDVLLFPGHGPPSSIRAEKLYNTGWSKN